MHIGIKFAVIAFTLLFSAGHSFAVGIHTVAAQTSQNVTGNAVIKTDPVDINTASVAELTAISGIGSAYAEKIIAARPYANKAQLKSRKILPKHVYEQVKIRIIAKTIKK